MSCVFGASGALRRKMGASLLSSISSSLHASLDAVQQQLSYVPMRAFKQNHLPWIWQDLKRLLHLSHDV